MEACLVAELWSTANTWRQDEAIGLMSDVSNIQVNRVGLVLS